MVGIQRLARFRCRSRPLYLVMAAEGCSPLDGKYLERLGCYNPLAGDGGTKLVLNLEMIKKLSGLPDPGNSSTLKLFDSEPELSSSDEVSQPLSYNSAVKLPSNETFTKHFQKYEALTDSMIMKDKHTKMPCGFGFATFSGPSVIDRVLEDEHATDGRTVEVKRTVPKEMSTKDDPKTNKIFVGGIPSSLTEEMFTKHFQKYEALTDSIIMKDKHTKMPCGFGFATFSDPSVIDMVLEDEHAMDGRTVEVKRTVRKEMSTKDDPLTNKIFVGGIPSSLTEDKLKEHFSSYGKVVEHQIILDHSTRSSRGFGFVTFESKDAVERVMSQGKMHDLRGKQFKYMVNHVRKPLPPDEPQTTQKKKCLVRDNRDLLLKKINDSLSENKENKRKLDKSFLKPRREVFSRKLSCVPDPGEGSTPKPFDSEPDLCSQEGICKTLLYASRSKHPSQGAVSQLLPPAESQANQEKTCLVHGNRDLLFKNINEALSESKRKLDKSFLKTRYNSEFRPQLVSCCLVLPEGLHSASTEFLHTQHHKLNRRTPQYLSSYEVMLQNERVDNDEEWDHFWNQIISNRVFIVEDWDSNVGNVETLRYDYGIKDFYKGEVDASYLDGKNGNPGKATFSVVIWKDDKIVCAEVYKEVACSSIHVAEAYAVLALFFKCFEMEIKHLVLWTDNSDIQGCITGSYTIYQSREEEERDLLLMLGCMTKQFTHLTAVHKPRELLFLADFLATYPHSLPGLEVAVNKFAYELSKKAVFRLSLARTAKIIINKFEIKPYMKKPPTKFFLLVDHLDKMEAIGQIKETLCPSELHLAIQCLEEKSLEFQSKLEGIAGSTQGIVNGECTIIHHSTKYKGKRLLVVVDGLLPKDRYDFLGCFTIILVSSMERSLLDPEVEELSALSYRYFSGVHVEKGTKRR